MFPERIQEQQGGKPKRDMERQTAGKGGIWFGLRAQTLCGLLAIFALSALILSWMASRQLAANREEQIARELSVIRENTEVYVRQLLILNEANNDEESFRSLAEDIALELEGSGTELLAVCSRKGEMLAGSLQSGSSEGMSWEHLWARGRDLAEAVDGNAAFTLVYEEEGVLTVLFSMPVSVEGKSFAAMLHDPSVKTRQDLYFAYNDLLRSVKKEGWKLIEYRGPAHRTQLFNLNEDPLELDNLAEKLPDKVGELRQLMQRYRADWEDGGHRYSQNFWQNF